MATENKFPTIRDLRDGLSMLIDKGLGEHPVQVVIVPGSTMRVIARAVADYRDDAKPPLIIELTEGGPRIPVSILSTDYLTGLKPIPEQ